MRDIWSYPQDSGYTAADTLIGFTVEAGDGTIGQVERHTDEPGASRLVVDTGVWVFGKSVLVPAGLVSRVEVSERRLIVDATKEQIDGAPKFARDSETSDPEYLDRVAAYYLGLPADAAGA